MEVSIGGAAAKNDKNAYLLLIMRVRLSHKIGLHNLMNHNRFQKETARNNVQNVFANTAKFVS